MTFYLTQPSWDINHVLLVRNIIHLCTSHNYVTNGQPKIVTLNVHISVHPLNPEKPTILHILDKCKCRN